MSKLRIIQITSKIKLLELAESWQELSDQDEQASIFNDWHWNSLWWEHYGHLGDLLVLLVYKDEQLVGLAPFYRTQSPALGLGKTDTLRFIGTGGDTSPDDLNIISHDSMRQSVAEIICDYLFSHECPARLLLVDVNTNSSFYKTFTARAKSAKGYQAKLPVQSRCCATLPNDWTEFRKQISRNTHKQMKRRQNRLNASGNAVIQVCTTSSEVETAFDALIELHSARWQSKGESGSFGSPTYQAFHRALMQQLLKLGQLWLMTLKLDDQIIAVEYAYLCKGTLMFFQTGFNPDYENLSPGHVMMTSAIQQAVDAGVERIDLLKGDYEYKTSYANDHRDSASLVFYRRGFLSLAARLNDFRLQLKS